MGKICTKWTMKALELRHKGLCSFLITNFEQISRINLVFSLLNLNLFMPAEKVFSFILECFEC